MKKILAMTMAGAMLAATAIPAAAEEKTTIEMWTLFTGDDGATMDKIVGDYNSSQDQVELKHVAIDRETLYTKLALAMNDEEVKPDLFVTYTYDTAYFKELGYVQPMDDILAGFEEFDFAIDKYHDACAEFNYLDGQRYTISLDFPTWGMYVNNNLAEQYCPEVMEDQIVTWDEVKAVGEKLKSEGVEDIKTLVCSWDRNDLLNTYLDLAGTYASEDGKELQLNKEAVIEMINTYKECYDAGYLWEEGDDPSSLFAVEEAIFYTGGTWNMSAVNEYGFDFSFIAPPQFTADDAPTLTGGSHAFFMPAQEYTEEEKTAMCDWMHYFYENSLAWAGAGSVVASKEAAQSDEYKAMGQAFVGDSYSVTGPNYVYTQTLYDVLDNLDWEAVYGRMTAEEFADSWEKQTQELVAAK